MILSVGLHINNIFRPKGTRQHDERHSAIAAATGFCNASYFSKAFRRLAGCVPRTWRARHRQT